MSEKSVILNKIISGGAMILAFLTPLFFLPFTYDFYEFNKNILLVFFVSVMLIVWLLRMAFEKKITFRQTPLDLPILVFAGAFILSNIFVSVNKWEALWTPGGTGTIISFLILYFIITNNIKKIEVAKMVNALTFGATLLGLLTIYQFIILRIPGVGQAFLLKNLFPAGGLIPLASFLVIILIVNLAQIFLYRQKISQKSYSSFIFPGLTSLIILAGLIFAVWQLWTTNKPLFLPYSTAWAIALETLKQGKSFFFGVGPTSFLNAFFQFRPSAYNLSNLWAIRFGSSSNYYLHLLTTVGVLGLGSFIWLIVKTFKTQKNQAPLPLFLGFLTVLVIFVFLPPNFLMIFSFFFLLSLLATDNLQNDKEFDENSKITPWIILAVFSVAVLGNFYLVGRAYAADVYFKISLNAMAKNEGTNTYNNQIRTITLNPYHDLYHLAYSQTNLALAYSLAQKTNLSDQERQNITILIQQAITEAKAAINLNKNNVIDWENLADIYRQLLNFAQGADQWTVSALSQAIKLDPTNPSLRLNLGGIFFALQNYDEAIRFFQQAIELKPDFANGYYNLAAAYREKKDFQNAHNAMQITLNLVPISSADYNKAKAELDELASKLPSKEATPGAETQIQTQTIPVQQPLVEPQPYPSPVITPPIELPEDQAAPDISPAPSATN